MAKVIIEGTVTRLYADRGFVVTESWKTKTGEPKSQNYKVWVDNPSDMPTENSFVKVEGNISARLEQFTNSEGKHVEYVAIHVNQPRLQVNSIPSPGDWSIPNDEIPF